LTWKTATLSSVLEYRILIANLPDRCYQSSLDYQTAVLARGLSGKKGLYCGVARIIVHRSGGLAEFTATQERAWGNQ
jgi:hypothetical protein